MPPSRRTFCTQAGSLLLFGHAYGRMLQHGPAESAGHPTARPNVAAIDRERILAEARRAAAEVPQTITAYPAPGTPGGPGDFYSTAARTGVGAVPKPAATGSVDAEKGRAAPKLAPDAEPTKGEDRAVQAPGVQPPGVQPFAAHREALLRMTLAVPALAAAYLLLRTTEPEAAEGYARKAMGHLRAWFVAPETRMTPSLEFGATVAGSSKPQFEAVLETVAVAEVAVAAAALASSGTARTEMAEEIAAVRGWFREYLQWLTTSRQAALARDQKDHHGSSWLLQSSAYALLAGDEAAVSELRHRYKTVTLRAQIVADGVFPHELTTENPYRNSLFNLDMMAAVTDLLSTRFETLWEFQLQDGPGMRVVSARFFPFIERRSAWPYKADATRFSELPCRRPGLLFAARAYDRPEYAEVWRGLPAEPTDPVILATFPIRQPLLWVTRPRV